MVDKPTRICKDSSTLIDIIATTNIKNISITEVISLSLSDHDMVFCIRKMNHQKYAPKYTTTRNYARYNPINLKNELKLIDWYSVLKCNDVNKALSSFTEILNDVFNHHAPFITKRTKGKPSPWIDREIHHEMDQRDQILRKARRSNNEVDWKLYRKLKNRCTKRLRLARKGYHQNLLNENRLNPRNFWKSIKRIFPTKSKTNTSFINCKEKATSFSEYFANAINKIKRTCYHLKDLTWSMPMYYHLRTKCIFKFQYVSVVFIRKELKLLSRNKATGLDNLPPVS
jgi:hypothetical protein